MALGTPVTGAVAYSASAGTSVSPAYPAGIGAGDVLVLFVGQKPSTANGGTVTTPTGWTLQTQLVGAGGYGTTLGADTGNTNLRVYTKDTVTGSETGNLAVTLGVNGVAWAFMVLVPTGGGAISYGDAAGSRTTTPTSPMSVALTLTGTAAAAFEANDLALWAMCIPTDVTTPSQFSAQSITATGVTFNTAVELNEPDSTTGNDIGGYSAYAFATAGTATTTPTVTTSIAGTLTNVRGPIVLLRVREAVPPSQSLTQNARFDNTNNFFTQTVTKKNTLAPTLYSNTNQFFTPDVIPGTETLLPARYDNTNTFYTAAVTQTGGAQTLNPALYTNTNTFYAQTLTNLNMLVPSRYNNTNTFYTATVTTTRALLPNLYTNTNTFYPVTVTSGTAILAPGLYTNTNTFYSAAVTSTRALDPARYDNTNTFYPATVAPGTVTLAPDLYTNTNNFYSPTVIQGAAVQTLLPDLYTNTNSFYSPSASATYTLELGPYVDDGYVDPWYIGLALQNVSQFYTPTVVPGAVTLTPNLYTNTNVFYAATVESTVTLSPARYDNTNTFYAATIAPGAINLVAPFVENTNTFYSAVIASGAINLTPARYDNNNTFFTPLVVVIQFVEPDLYVNTNSFFAPAVSKENTLRPALFRNDNEFFRPTLLQEQFVLPETFFNTNRFPQAKLTYRIAAPLLTNTNTFFAPTASGLNTLTPALFANDNSFFTPTVVPPNATLFPALYANDNEFPRPTVTPGAINLAPALFSNTNAFYAASAYQFWNIRPYFFLNINTVFPPVVLRGKPIPNWNPDTIANGTNYAAGDIVANPNFTPQPAPPVPSFNLDGQTATPDWNPQ